jgi:xylulokinase
VVAAVKPDVAKELGVSGEMTICTGALDQAAGTIGVGNIAPGLFSENTGAALAICATVNSSFMDPAFQMPCHYHGIKDLYMAHTFTTGGMALKWFRDAFCDMEILLGTKTDLDDYYLMDQEVKKVPAGSDGLVMLPHLQGAMAPESNPKAKGVYFGITMKHTRAHFIRAVMEGVGFIVMRNIEAIESMGIPVREIRVLGGGSKSSVWNQIKADITGRVIWTTDNSDAACLGAAILSGVSCGFFPNVKDAVEKMVNLKQKFEPDMENHKVYQKLFGRYKQLYTALCPLFEISG